MRTTKCTALFAAALLAGAFALPAAEMPQGQLLLIHEEIASPAKLPAYEATTKEFLAAIQTHGTTFPPYDVVMTQDFSYYFVLPIKAIGDVNLVHQGFAEVSSKMGETRFADLWRRGGDAMVASNDFIALERADLSYWPAAFTAAAAQAAAINYDIYYLLPGREREVEQIAREWQALYKKHGMTEGYMIYQALTGNELPVWAVTFYGKSPADLAAKEEAVAAKLGAEGQALRARTLELVRRFEKRIGTRRPDLSYRPAAMTAAN